MGGGTKGGIASITGKIRHFFWSSIVQHSRARVSWQVCCLKRCDGGLNLIDLIKAVTSLMSKWVVTTCELGNSNFKVILRYRLSQFQSHSNGLWDPSPEWFYQPQHKAPRGSKAWLCTCKAWKTMSMNVVQRPP